MPEKGFGIIILVFNVPLSGASFRIVFFKICIACEWAVFLLPNFRAKKALEDGRDVGRPGKPRWLTNEQERAVVDRIRADFRKGDGHNLKVVRQVMAMVKEGRDLPFRVADFPNDLDLPSARIANLLVDRAGLKSFHAPSTQADCTKEGTNIYRKSSRTSNCGPKECNEHDYRSWGTLR